MTKSMTGYGRSEISVDHFTLAVELRSVNHRYQEIYLRIPRELFSIEDDIKKTIQERIKRGRIDCTITMENREKLGKHVYVDWEMVKGYYAASMEIKKALELTGELSLTDLLKFEDIFTYPKVEEIEGFREVLLEAVHLACNELTEMRLREGKVLDEDLRKRINHIKQEVEKVQSLAPKVIVDYRERLRSRIEEFLQGRGEIDENRLLTEIALYADKADIDEEITRLKSHCNHFCVILDKEEPIGRKLDFLIQEMNREINTIGSKANDLSISQIVVEVKSEIEKIREQVQNIE